MSSSNILPQVPKDCDHSSLRRCRHGEYSARYFFEDMYDRIVSVIKKRRKDLMDYLQLLLEPRLEHRYLKIGHGHYETSEAYQLHQMH